MKPKDNNPLTLLAWSDWLEENNQLELAEEIRAEVVGANWHWEYNDRSRYSVRLTSEDIGCEHRGGDYVGGFINVVGAKPYSELHANSPGWIGNRNPGTH